MKKKLTTHYDFIPTDWIYDVRPKRISSKRDAYKYPPYYWSDEKWRTSLRLFMPFSVIIKLNKYIDNEPIMLSTELSVIHSQLIDWINKHCNGYWTDSITIRKQHERINFIFAQKEFIFELEDDALMFKLIWC